MPRLRVLLAALVIVSLASGPAALASSQSKVGDIHIEQVAPSLFGTNVDARITLVDTGTSLHVTGTATGLTVGKAYFSLLYDVESEDSGPAACEPGIAAGPGSLTIAQMIVGFWTPPAAGSSTWTIDVTKTGPSYVALERIGTMSVRIVLGPPPAGFVIQGCGSL